MRAIRLTWQRIEGYKADMAQLAQNTLPNEDGFSPMIMAGGTVTDKKAAGEAIIGLCKSMTNPDPIHIGEYRGFDMELFFDSFSREYKITLKHELRHTVFRQYPATGQCTEQLPREADSL